jgi:hypothetical protein
MKTKGAERSSGGKEGGGVAAGGWEGSQKGKIANFEESERNHHQVRKETVQEEQEEIQRWLLQGKNWIFHEEWIERKRETMADGLPSQAWYSGCEVYP